MEDLERIKSRLDNIRGVAPILTALRNIAAGGWRLARVRLDAARAFSEELSNIARALLPLLPPSALRTTDKPANKVGMLVVASERGLCGAYNTLVLEAAEGFMAEMQGEGQEVSLLTLGSRAASHFQRKGTPLLSADTLPVTTVPSLAFVQQLHGRLSRLLDEGQIDRLHMVYTPYQTRQASKPELRQMLPAEFEPSPSASPPWPEPIIDGDPVALYERVRSQWSVVELYRAVIESAASEQSARFRVLDGASTNCSRLIEELTLSYHAARQHAITMEMLDLVGGAGLLGSQEDGKAES